MDRKFWKLQRPSWSEHTRSLPPGAVPLLSFFALTLGKETLYSHSGPADQGLARAAGARMRAGGGCYGKLSQSASVIQLVSDLQGLQCPN